MKTLVLMGTGLFLVLFAPLCSGAIDRGHFPEYIRRCSNYTDDQLSTLNLAFSLTAMLSLMVIGLMFMIILCRYHKANNIIDRLFIYLVIVNGVYLIIGSMTITHWFQYSGDGLLCKSLGFMAHYSGAVASFLHVVIALGLLCMVYKSLNENSKLQLTIISKHSICLEGILFLFAAAFPFSYSWFIFLKDGFGFSFYTCWLKAFEDDKNCGNYSGIKTQITIISISLVHDVITVVLAIVLAFMCACIYKKIRNPQVLALIRKPLLLMLFIFIRSIIILITTVVRAYFTNYVFLVFCTIIIVPFASLALPIGYLIYLFKFRSSKRSQPVRPINIATLQTNRASARSSHTDTYFEVEHTPIGLESGYLNYAAIEEQPVAGPGKTKNRERSEYRHNQSWNGTHFTLEFTPIGQESGYNHNSSLVQEIPPAQEKASKQNKQGENARPFLFLLPCCNFSKAVVTADPPDPTDNIPSETYFNNEYTGQFTDINTDIAT